MKSVINSMIEAEFLTREEEARFDTIDALFDILHKQTSVNEPWSLMDLIHRNELKQDLFFQCHNGDTVVERRHYDNNYAYAIELLKFRLAVITESKPNFYSLACLLTDALDEMMHDEGVTEDINMIDDDSFIYTPPKNEYCTVLSHLLAKLTTENVQAHGALMLYYHSQFVRIGIVEMPTLID